MFGDSHRSGGPGHLFRTDVCSCQPRSNIENAIELNLHRIESLAEEFVLFNDDMFLLRPTEKKDFFIKGIPRDEMVERAIVSQGKMLIDHTNINNIGVINSRFKKKCNTLITKRFNLNYGIFNMFTLLSLPYKHYTGFRNPHLPQAHLKSTFSNMWEVEYDKLDKTCSNKFRGYNDLSHWLMRYDNLCKGKFVPRTSSFGKCFTLPNDIVSVYKYISRQTGTTICINDSIDVTEYISIQSQLKEAFESILGDKCSFEL